MQPNCCFLGIGFKKYGVGCERQNILLNLLGGLVRLLV